ncbi:MAG: right-handed parallel beta-helix repeat-containing protein [Acidobacteria bacterium]|nr:right-handed parallel beta-helix repeat-containing protein [Acidobacteriota bacterium]
MKVGKILSCAAVLGWLSAASAQAQPAAFDLRVEAISHATVAIRFQIEGLSRPTRTWVEYGPTHTLGFRTDQNRSSTTSAFRSVTIGGLAPDSRYYFRVMVQDEPSGAVATWYCPSGESGTGYACDGPDAPPTFHTAPLPTDGPILPAEPERFEQPFPQITGERFDVGVDEQQRCLDLQAQLNAAAAADPEKNHEVVIPAGATCYGEHVLPRKRGSGVVLVRPSTPLDFLPPAGVRIDPSFRPLMATLSVPPDWRTPGIFPRVALSTASGSGCETPCTEGWRLVGLEVTHPGHSDVAPRSARILAFSERRAGETVVELDAPFQVQFGQAVAIGGVTGAAQLNRVWTVTPVSETSFAIATPLPEGGVSGGYATQAFSLHVEGCTAGPQPVCRTGLPHGLPEPPAVAIESVDNAVVKTPSLGWPFVSTVEITGAPAGYDGLWGATQVSGGVRLTGPSTPTGACSGGCGEARPRTPVQTFAFDAEPRLNGSHLYTVVSETEVRLDDVTEATAEVSSGYLTVDPNSYPRLVVLGAEARNIVLDRCWLHGRGFPSRLQAGIAISSSDSALVDSMVSQVNSWRAITPLTGAIDLGVFGSPGTVAFPITIGDASRVTVRNNLIENSPGITLYVEQFRLSSELTPTDLVIEGNTFHNDDSFRPGAGVSNGRYHGFRHAIELKRGQRVSIANNVIDGVWADIVPLGPAIGLLSRGGADVPNNRIQDVSVRNNVLRRVATGIQLLGVDDQIDAPSLPMARVAIENNLFESVDYYTMRGAPSQLGGFGPPNNFGGQIVYSSGTLEDLTIRHNTAVDNRGRGPTFFWYGVGRGSGVQVTDNILTHNDDFSYGGLPRPDKLSQFETKIEGTPKDGFELIFTQTPNPDPRSSFARNLVLPGVRDSSSPKAYDDPEPGRNFTKGDCEAFYAGFDQIECAGAGGVQETANQRLAAVFPNRSAVDSVNGRGADVASLSAAKAGIRGANAIVTGGAASLELQTGAGESCFVDLSETSDFAQFRRLDAPGGELRTIALDGLESGRTYHYRVKCSSETRFGELTVP